MGGIVAGSSTGIVRRINQAAHIARRFWDAPDYAFGRFALVRDAHAVGRRLRPGAETGTIAVGEKYGARYGEGIVDAPIAPSGLIRIEGDAAAHRASVLARSVSTGLTLAPEAVAALTALAHERPLSSAHHPDMTFAAFEAAPDLRRVIPLLSARAAAQDATVQRIASDAKLIDAVSAVLGYRARTASVWLFWSLANALTQAEREASHQTVRFHYDVDGLSFVYANFYLTETNADSGAHVLIENTHRGKTMRQLIGTARMDDAAAEAQFGKARIRTLTGPAGTGFIEDSSCYHKALPPQTKDRLMFQIRYK